MYVIYGCSWRSIIDELVQPTWFCVHLNLILWMFDIFFISEFILGTGFLKKAFGEFYFPQNFRRSTLKFCNWFQMDLITWFYSPKSQWREAFWDDFFWEVDIPLRPSLFVGRGTYKDGSGIIMLNWSMLKSTYVWEHCAVQIAVSWYCMVVRAQSSSQYPI